MFCLLFPYAMLARGLEGQISGVVLTVLWLVTQTSGAAVGIAAYAWATRKWGPPLVIDAETRCRKCGYILRGITEPRCPECGERI
jgi:predicted Zn-ribbon and HTH transcriptional regulator